MTTEAEVIAEQFADVPALAIRRGLYVGLNGDRQAIVDMGDSRFVCGWGSGWIPEVGEIVQVLTVGMQNLLYPTSAKPGEGTVLSSGSGVVNVQTAAGDFTMPYTGSAPTAGQRVAIVWSEGPRCVGVLSSTVTAPEPPPNPTGGTGPQTVTFRAAQAGSTDRGSARWWTPNPQASNSTYGAWFYGSAIRDTIPAGAIYVGLQIKVNRRQDQGGPPRWVFHDDLAPASTLPTFSSPYAEWDPPFGWQTPPFAVDLFNALKSGGGWAGVGLNQGGYNIFASLAQDSESGALRISWR